MTCIARSRIDYETSVRMELEQLRRCIDAGDNPHDLIRQIYLLLVQLHCPSTDAYAKGRLDEAYADAGRVD